jgi:hypothetical protein
LRRRGQIEAEFLDWGQALLAGVGLAGDAGDTEALGIWRRFAQEGHAGRRLTVESQEPTIARLPWEMLADHNGFLFSQGIIIQRRIGSRFLDATEQSPLPLRLLMLTSRPDDAAYSNFRRFSGALLKAVEGLKRKPVVEFLQPPTFDALRRRLADQERPVHAVLFDGQCEGAFRQGFLLFEDDAHLTDSVDASSLGSTLLEGNIPLFMLHAAPGTTHQESSPPSTVSMGLLAAGVPHVVSTSYAMSSGAISAFLESLFRGLMDGLSVAESVDSGRRALLPGALYSVATGSAGSANERAERSRISDWFLPCHYQGAEDTNLVLVPPDGDGVPSHVPALPGPSVMVDSSFPGSLPAEPQYGFHGRSRELHRLIRTFATHSIIIVSGHAGAGKTALATEAGKWLFRSGQFLGGVVYVSFDRGASLNLLCLRIGQAATDDIEFTSDDEHGAGPIEQVSNLLQQKPMLIILDHFEAVTRPGQLSPRGEVNAIMEAIWLWCDPAFGRGNKALISTSESNIDFMAGIPRQHTARISLQGLTRTDALALAGAILVKQGLDLASVDSRALADLADHVGGHPASLYLVFPLLRFWVPARLSASLETLMPGFTTGTARNPRESLKATLDFYLRRLGEDVLRDMPALAVFRGGAMEAEILWITRLDPELWQVVRASLAEASLVTLEALPGIGPPFIRFHAALSSYLADRLSPDRRGRLEEAYWRRYYALAKHLFAEDRRHARQTRAIALRELPNMYRATEILAESGRLEQASELARNMARFLKAFGRNRELEALFVRLEGYRQQVAPPSQTERVPPWTQSLVATVVQAIKGGEDATKAATEFLSKLAQAEPAVVEPEGLDKVVAGEGERWSAGVELFGEQISRDIAARLAAVAPDLDIEAVLQEDRTEQHPAQVEEAAADEVITAHVREEWELVIQTVVSACQGNESASADLPPLLEQMSRDEDWRELARVIASIIAGERDQELLLDSLDEIDAIIVRDILQLLANL